jgi:hypothetical protein
MSDTTLENPEVEQTGSGGKRRLDPSTKRNFKIVGGGFMGILLIAFLIVFWRGGDEEQARPSKIAMGASQNLPAGETSPAVQAMLEQQQAAEAKAAAARGISYIPPDTHARTEPVEVAPEPMAMGMPESNHAAATNAVRQDMANTLSESDQRRREGLARQLAALIPNDVTDTVRERVSAEGAGRDERQVPTSQANQPSSTPAEGSAARSNSRTVLPMHHIAGAELASDLQVPANRSVFASLRINTGPAAGAYLTGTARVIDESLEISLTQMSLNDRAYAIDAVVLDQQTANNAIAGNVDRRIFQRYVMPITLAVAQGFFDAKSKGGTQIVGIPGVEGAAAVSQQPPTIEQARAAGVSKGLEIASQEVQKSAQAPIVVSAPRGIPVGLLFRKAVTEEQK